jgi:hypothetical protein
LAAIFNLNLGRKKRLSLGNFLNPDFQGAFDRSLVGVAGRSRFMVVRRAERLIDDADTEHRHIWVACLYDKRSTR